MTGELPDGIGPDLADPAHAVSEPGQPGRDIGFRAGQRQLVAADPVQRPG